MESSFKDSKMRAKASVRQSRPRPPVVAILAQLLAYGLTVFAVAPHPESDSASIRVQLSSATHGKELCRAAFRKLQSGESVQRYHFSQAVGSLCCRNQQRRR